jgi:alpha-glucosidase
MAVSGIPYVGMDIGGFIGEASAELYIRWMNLGIYSPLMRQHSTIDSRFHEPWLFGEANTRIIRGLLEQRYQLLPYLYSSFYQAHINGMPINRMLPVEYTFDDKVYSDKYANEFLFGDNVLVCPVDSKTSATEVYLPGNGIKWYRISSGKAYDGGQSHFVASPLNDLPVFVKESAIVPLQGVVQSTKERGDGVLYVHIWKGSNSNSFVYYEDDGNTYNYEKSEFYKRTIFYLPQSSQIVLEAKEGSYSSRFDKIKLVLHNFEKPITVTVNGTVVAAQHPDSLNTIDFANANNKIIVQLK